MLKKNIYISIFSLNNIINLILFKSFKIKKYNFYYIKQSFKLKKHLLLKIFKKTNLILFFKNIFINNKFFLFYKDINPVNFKIQIINRTFLLLYIFLICDFMNIKQKKLFWTYNYFYFKFWALCVTSAMH